MNYQSADFFKQRRKTQYKVIMIGDSFVGKTSLCYRYSKNRFGQDYKATLGAEYFSREISTGVNMQIVDTAGQERFLSVASSYYRGADAAVICYDVTNRQSFTNLANWLDIISQEVNTKETPVIIMGNKCDMINNRQVDNILIIENNLEGFPFVEVSAKSGFNVESAFDVLIDQMIYGIENKMYQGKSFIWGGYNYIPANGKLLRISDSSDYSRWFKVEKAEFNVDIIGTNARVEAVLDIASERCSNGICMFALTIDDFYENLSIKVNNKELDLKLAFQSSYASYCPTKNAY